MEDHRRLDVLFDDVLARLRFDDRGETREAWRQFERALVTHMEAEERPIIPAFRLADPAEAALVLDDHRRFRETIDELGLDVELHLVRADWVGRFVQLLRAHARREDLCMYPWAESHLSTQEQASLSAWLHSRERALQHSH